MTPTGRIAPTLPRVTWMRHGTSVDGLCRPDAHARPSSPLAIIGAVEVESAARRIFAEYPAPGRIVTSPLRRARQTAAIVSAATGHTIADPLSVFEEWRAPECVLGLAPVDYPRDYQMWRAVRARYPTSALPGGESLQAFAARAATANATAQALADEHGRVLIISHRVLIGAVAATVNGIRDPAEIFAHATGFDLEPAEIWA